MQKKLALEEENIKKTKKELEHEFLEKLFQRLTE